MVVQVSVALDFVLSTCSERSARKSTDELFVLALLVVSSLDSVVLADNGPGPDGQMSTLSPQEGVTPTIKGAVSVSDPLVTVTLTPPCLIISPKL